MSAVRWENVQLRVFQDGADIGTLNGTRFSDREEFQDDKSKYQGSEIPDGDATYMGGTCSMTLELQNGSVNLANMVDRYRDGVKRRNGRGRIVVLASHR